MKEDENVGIRYFDHAATTYIRKEVLEEMMPYLKEEYGNPSSQYRLGRKAKQAIEVAREKVAKVINAKSSEIYFTSGGTESDNLALKGIMYANIKKGNHIITSKIEHPAILNTCKELENEGFKVTYVDVDNNGIVNIKQLLMSINCKTVLISIMYANNEIGSIQPIEEIGKIAKIYNIIFHTDAVQCYGNLKIDVNKLGIDSLSLSGHKIYGPKGVGALYVKKGIEFVNILSGGHQEKEKRPGTENVAGIVGLGEAAEEIDKRMNENIERNILLRNYFIKKMQEKNMRFNINGTMNNRLSGNINISLIDIDGNDLLNKLDSKGICVSNGSACSSGKMTQSHVLKAIGLSKELSKNAIRITLGEENTKEDMDYLVESIFEMKK